LGIRRRSLIGRLLLPDWSGSSVDEVRTSHVSILPSHLSVGIGDITYFPIS
jgi:hypothetical protein